MTTSGQDEARVVIDAHGVVVEFDAGAERLFGFRGVDAVGRALADLIIPSRLREAHETGLRRFRATGLAPLLGGEYEMPAVRADGAEIMVRLTVTSRTEAGRTIFTATVRDAGVDRRTPAELQLSDQFHQAVLARSPLAIIVLRAGEPLWWSPTADVLFGPVADGRSGEAWFDLIHPSDQETARMLCAPSSRRILTGSARADLRIFTRDQGWRVFDVIATDLADQPAVRGIVLHASDVTSARRAEQRAHAQRRLLDVLIEALNVGVLLHDDQRRVLAVNAAFTNLLGVPATPDALRGRAWDPASASQPADERAFVAGIQECIAGRRPVGGAEIATKDGRSLEQEYIPVDADGLTSGHMWVYKDVTNPVAARHRLDSASRKLAELEALKTEFVTTVSHELRTPLTSLASLTGLLLESSDDSRDPDHVACLSAIDRNARQLLGLVDDLLLLARMESGRAPMRWTPVDLPALLRESARQCAAGVASRGVKVTCEAVEGQTVVGDPEWLARMVNDLIHAVLADLADGGSVTVCARPGSQRDPAAGGDKDWLIEITGRQTPLPATTPANGCAEPDAGPRAAMLRQGGLRLAMSRAIAQRHGGRILMRAAPDGGFWLTVALPVRPAGAATGMPPS